MTSHSQSWSSQWCGLKRFFSTETTCNQLIDTIYQPAFVNLQMIFEKLLQRSRFPLTLYILVLSADNFYRQFGPKSDQTKRQA